jgi:hypothetical protein
MHSVPVPINVRCYSNSDIIVRRSEVTRRADCVAKLFFGMRTKFSRTAGAPFRKLCGGSHDQSDFQPAAFVRSLQGIGLSNTGFAGRDANFGSQLIFEFCNTIGQQQTLVQRAEIERCNARAMSDCPQIAEVSLMR